MTKKDNTGFNTVSGLVVYKVGYTVLTHSFETGAEDETVQSREQGRLAQAILAAADASHVGDYAARWYVGLIEGWDSESSAAEPDDVVATIDESELQTTFGWADIRTTDEGVTFS